MGLRRSSTVVAVISGAIAFAGCAQGGAGDYYGDDGGPTGTIEAGGDVNAGGDDGGGGGRPGRDGGGGGGNDSGDPIGQKDSGTSTGNDSGSGVDSGTAVDSGSSGDDGGSGGTDSGGVDSGNCTTVTVTAPPAHGGGACSGKGTAKCYPHDVTGFGATWVPPVAHNTGACTAAQIADYYTQCFGTGSGCLGWPLANAGCYACLVTDHTAPSWGALIAYGQVSEVNLPGCIAESEPCNLPCAQAMQDNSECYNTACDPTSPGVCNVKDQTTFDAYNTCATNADATCGCTGYSASAQCETALAAAPHPAFATCYGSNAPASATFQQLYTAVATYMCGP